MAMAIDQELYILTFSKRLDFNLLPLYRYLESNALIDQVEAISAPAIGKRWIQDQLLPIRTHSSEAVHDIHPGRSN
ncbi:hypothetical protein D3C86_1768840 [compost metagenome]